MSAPHTPGPWKVGRHLGSRTEVRLIHHDAGDHGQGVPIIEGAVSEANARLIAAAPDMFAALESIAEGCAFPADDVQRAIRRRALAAIDKAEGRS